MITRREFTKSLGSAVVLSTLKSELRWDIPGYDLIPKLHSLRIPTLVIAGDHDFFPDEVAGHIAQALPNARLVTMKDCGHFAFLECPDAVRNALRNFFNDR